MRTVVLLAAAIALCASEFVWAATPTCEAQAAAKKLSVGDQASFIHKCQKDATKVATEACNSQADGENLTGHTKKRFVKKCVKEATATKRPVKIVPGVG